MNIKDRTYSSTLSLVKNDIYFRCQILRRTEKYSHCNTLEQILNFIGTLKQHWIIGSMSRLSSILYSGKCLYYCRQSVLNRLLLAYT